MNTYIIHLRDIFKHKLFYFCKGTFFMVHVVAERVVLGVIDFILFCSCASLSFDVVLREKNTIFNEQIIPTKVSSF